MILPRIITLLACVCLVHCAPAGAADWAQWRGPERTGYVPVGERVPAALPAEADVVWRIAVGEGFASPVVAGGKLFHLDSNRVKEFIHAVDAATGKPLWKEELFAAHRDGFGVGPRCTPLVDGNRLFVQSCKGEFQCRSTEDGKLLWRTNFVDDFGAVYQGERGNAQGASRHGNNGSPVIDGENIIVQVGSPKGASLVCFKKSDGEVVWKSQDDQTAYAAPVVHTLQGVKQVISFSVEGLIGLDTRDGKLLWRVPLKTNFGRHVTTPVVVDDLVVVASHQIGLVGVRVSKEGDGWKAEPAWTNKALAINFSSPVAVGSRLYGLAPGKRISCIDLKSGETLWEKSGWVLSSPDRAYASFLVLPVDKETGKATETATAATAGTTARAGKAHNILMLSDGGELILFADDPGEPKELGRLQVCGANWCHPAYVDGKLFVRDAKELLCVNLMK